MLRPSTTSTKQSPIYVSITGASLKNLATPQFATWYDDVLLPFLAHQQSLHIFLLFLKWNTLALLLKSTETCHGGIISPMTYALMPTVRKLLLQRADAGDIQTCVMVSEIIGVIVPPPASGGSARCRISGIDLSVVQEWYLTYIDMLRSLGMFMKTTELVRNCRDPVIASLSRQSTTVSESCPKCGKVQDGVGMSAYRLCRNCRQRIGYCFVSHLPCKGMYVFCPGCGHGGCMHHANEW